jgi:hypothetical protein
MRALMTLAEISLNPTGYGSPCSTGRSVCRRRCRGQRPGQSWGSGSCRWWAWPVQVKQVVLYAAEVEPHQAGYDGVGNPQFLHSGATLAQRGRNPGVPPAALQPCQYVPQPAPLRLRPINFCFHATNFHQRYGVEQEWLKRNLRAERCADDEPFTQVSRPLFNPNPANAYRHLYNKP